MPSKKTATMQFSHSTSAWPPSVSSSNTSASKSVRGWSIRRDLKCVPSASRVDRLSLSRARCHALVGGQTPLELDPPPRGPPARPARAGGPPLAPSSPQPPPQAPRAPPLGFRFPAVVLRRGCPPPRRNPPAG